MIRRLIILLLIVGCVFGDTITYRDTSEIVGYFRDVKYVGVEDGKIYFLNRDNYKNYTYCGIVVEITDYYGSPIEFDCGEKKNYMPPSQISQVVTSSNELILAGKNLIQFRKDYYTGFLISTLGNVATLYGASKNKSDIILYGGVASLLGGIMMLISFDSVGEAGEDLIDAGERLETEQDSP
jgi:hypothetical protein